MLYVFGYVNPYVDGGPLEGRHLRVRGDAIAPLAGPLAGLVVQRTYELPDGTGLVVTRVEGCRTRAFRGRADEFEELAGWTRVCVIDVAVASEDELLPALPLLSRGCPMRSSALAAPVALLLIAAAVPAHDQRTRGGRLYELVPLEAGTSTRATDVNVRGQACGLVTEPSGTVALRWSTAAGLTPLAPAPGYPRSLALGITRDGFVLGQSFSPSFPAATLWSPSGTPTALPSLGWSLVEPAAIREAGVVVGRGYAGGPWQPWVWDALNGTRLLAPLGFPVGATVTDVDANGVLAGAPAFGEAFLFDLATGTRTPLGTLGGDTSAALALDESGFVVGWSQTPPANERAPFFWSPAGGMRSLGTPSGPGDVDGQAHDVNRHGVVVGAFEPAPGVTHAFVWEEGPGLRDLNALVRARGGVELLSALHLSDSGWIAGIARDHSQGGKTVGFLLRPL